MSGAAAVARARALVGVRFRPQGRGRGGLDCIGLAGAAFAIERLPRDYALRGGDAAMMVREIMARGFAAIEVAQASAGDLVLVRPGAEQLHLAVLTAGGCIHADAGVGRVVERPGELPWPILGAWRRKDI